MSSQRSLSEIAAEICAHHGWALGRLVGKGAFKESFEITFRSGQKRALKVHLREHVGERTEREYDALDRCAGHPNVVTYERRDKWVSQGAAYIYVVEEFLDGGTLQERLRQGPLHRPDVICIARSLIAALAHLKTQRLVHRDIKPANIMFRGESRHAVLVDFGLVRDLDESSITKTFHMRGPGTPFYAAPEQLCNDKGLIDWRTDQFGLGVVLAECAGLGHPYASESGHNAIAVQAAADRQGPSERFVSAAEDARLLQLVTMVRPYPVERFRTPDALLAAWSEG